MISRSVLNDYLFALLQCEQFKDYAPNGLQIEGKSSIGRICTAVTADAATINQAIERKADALFVHHGYFWRQEEPVLTGMKYRRIASLITHQINLFAYHLPLDCYKEWGNNACIAQRLDLKTCQSHSINQVPHILWTGELTVPCDINVFNAQLFRIFGRAPAMISSGVNKTISRIAWCSGAAHDYIEQAALLGVDAYISGEVSERTYYQARELGVHYFSCGHHATERFGIQALGAHLAQQFQLDHHFIDSDNPY